VRHPEVPEAIRGTYAGLASPAAIAHLKSMGVTAVELLPVHEKVHDQALVERKLSNYWGYNTLNYFAPEQSYAAGRGIGEQVVEIKRMVKALHAAGIEVILDVVYNHTAEGNHLGRCSASRASTTAPTTAPSPATRATTWTTRAAATRSTCVTRRPSS
jgi:glycogen operon protein